MKIALVGPIPPPNGGMAMQTQQLNRLLLERGHEVTLIPVNSPYKPKIVSKFPIIRSLFRLAPYLWTLAGEIRKHDVVHIMANSGWAFYLFVFPAVIISLLLRKQVVINYRGGKAKQFFNSAWKRVRWCFNGSSRHLVVPSTYLESVFHEFGVRAQVIPNIVDLTHYAYSPPRVNADRLKIIVTRNLEKIYDNATAIRAFSLILKRYPKALLMVAGSGPLESELKDLTLELDLNASVRFLGRLDRTEMAKLYSEADIMLNPSTIDNMPNSVLEALSSGVLVVSTNVGGIPHMVQDRYSALLVPPNAPEKLAEAVIELVENPDLTSNLAENGLKSVEKYSPESVIPIWESTYERVST